MNNKYQLALTVLDRALTTRRPHGDNSTRKFSDWLMKLLPNPTVDGAGNIHVDLRSGVSRSLFVAHVDTVHRRGGKNKVIKTDKQWAANGAPLGADDGAGVALLCHMIHCQVPAYYIFTQGEECGGIGSNWLAKNMPTLLVQFDRAVAFDRRATYSVISHQGMGRCCSDAFAEALSDKLNARGMLFMPDDTGVYTDTAEFVSIIPECTNISVGYDMEHSDRETLDIDHFLALCKAAVKIDWEALPVARDPKAVDDFMFHGLSDKYWGAPRDLGRKSGERGTVGGTPLTSGAYDNYATYDDYLSDGDMLDRAAIYDLDMMVAIEDAFDGKLGPLVKMIAKAVSPGSPRIAEKQINRKLITEMFLAELLADASTVDTDTLLLMAFDIIGTGAWV